MSAVYRLYMCYVFFQNKNSAFYKKVTWYPGIWYLVSGINKIERKNKIVGFTS